MGKTKIKSIDDSQPEVEEKKVKKTKTVMENTVEVIARSDNDEAIHEAENMDRHADARDDADEEVSAGDGKRGAPETARREVVTTEDISGAVSRQDPPKKTTTSKKQRSKKYLQSNELVDKSQKYPLPEAITLVQKSSYSKFPGTLEIHINTNQTNLRGLVTLPFSTGKKLTILSFGKGSKEAGADIVGDEAIIESIGKGKINFDIVVTTAEWMPKLAKAAKVLGPRGLMPSPKNGTITDNLEKTIAELLGGKTEYKTESKNKVIHLGVGKITQPVEELVSNIEALYTTIGKSRIGAITLSATMSPGVKVELSSI